MNACGLSGSTPIVTASKVQMLEAWVAAQRHWAAITITQSNLECCKYIKKKKAECAEQQQYLA